MALAVHQRGRPVDWFTQDRTSRTAKTRERKARNKQLLCDAPGCNHHRDGLSSLCRNHAVRVKESGDPLSRLPTGAELAIFEKAIEIYLSQILPEGEKRKLEAELRYQTKLASRPISWAARPDEIHRRIPQKGRAEIVKAHVLKNGGNLREAVIRALAVEGWAHVYFDGLERYRERFIHTQAGLWFTRRGTPSEKRERVVPKKDTSTTIYTERGAKYPTIWVPRTTYERAHISGPVRQILGKEALDIAHSAFGKSFWESPVPTKGGETISLLDYTKLALRAAETF